MFLNLPKNLNKKQTVGLCHWFVVLAWDVLFDQSLIITIIILSQQSVIMVLTVRCEIQSNIWHQAKITIRRTPFSLSCLGDSAFIPSWFQLGAWALVCRNLCQRVGVRGYNGSLYNKGMNYCSRCAVYFHNEGATHCFCCGSKLRYKSRGAKKRKDQEEVLQHGPMRRI